jgi:hypothetical protein
MKIKKLIDGKEVEIEITTDDLKSLKLNSQTALLEDDELFNEAAEMRGIAIKGNGKTASRELSKLEKLVSSQQSEIESLKGLIDKVSIDKKTTDEQLQTYLAQQKSAQVDGILADAIKTGRITPEKKDIWAKRFEKDHDLAKEALLELPENKALGDQGNSGAGSKQTTMQTGASSGDKILDAISNMNQNAAINIAN